jgi:Cft2 family RNA processing exonuclease
MRLTSSPARSCFRRPPPWATAGPAASPIRSRASPRAGCGSGAACASAAWSFPLIISDHCDWPELLQTITETGAGEVWVTHGREEALVHELGKRGIAARALRLVGREDDLE